MSVLFIWIKELKLSDEVYLVLVYAFDTIVKRTFYRRSHVNTLHYCWDISLFD